MAVHHWVAPQVPSGYPPLECACSRYPYTPTAANNSAIKPVVLVKFRNLSVGHDLTFGAGMGFQGKGGS
jgi:hypothetical protein